MYYNHIASINRFVPTASWVFYSRTERRQCRTIEVQKLEAKKYYLLKGMFAIKCILKVLPAKGKRGLLSAGKSIAPPPLF